MVVAVLFRWLITLASTRFALTSLCSNTPVHQSSHTVALTVEGGMSVSCRSRKSSKYKTFKAALWFSRYLLCTKAEHPAKICATLSGYLPQSLHSRSSNEVVFVSLLVYNLGGNICSYSSYIPATLWVASPTTLITMRNAPSYPVHHPPPWFSVTCLANSQS